MLLEGFYKSCIMMIQVEKTIVRTPDGYSRKLGAKTGVYQASALSPMLFTVVLDVPKETREESEPCAMLFVNDTAIDAKRKEDLETASEN